ncbi:MAG: NAD(P) transhydrogenase subunit alpha [Gemmatimonadetes bacterium]|nr:NAD(P) transhydrogenase subunit alpha [Gemmatimonadota bacterium]
MILGIPKEVLENEDRVAALPDSVREYVAMGFDVLVETSAGKGALKKDEEYVAAGAKIVTDAKALFAQSDIILKVKQPHFNSKVGMHEADMLREGSILVTFLHPATPGNHDMIRKLRDRKITSFTMDSIPRISRAQSMDALTSMSTVTGYKSVIMAAYRFPRIIPILGTAIGTVKAAKFLIVGSGVVGLQAIATAKRLGASIKVWDISEAARKGADSLGAKIAGFDVPAEIALGDGGYAKALPEEWLKKERAALTPFVQEADVIIMSALVAGEVAPILITDEMVAGMKPGSVIMDVSVDQGGNCALTVPGQDVVKHDVFISGRMNIPGSVAVDSAWFYSMNMVNFVKNLFQKGIGKPDFEDDIVKETLVTNQGKIHHHGALKAMGEL